MLTPTDPSRPASIQACDQDGWFGYRALLHPLTIEKAYATPKDEKNEFWSEFFGNDRFLQAHVLIWSVD
jgi:hypothetical protein